MIDYFALALGHGLLAVALLRLMLREGLDADPLIEALKTETEGNRKASSVSGRNAARRARAQGPDDAPEEAPAPKLEPALRPRGSRVQAKAANSSRRLTR